MCEDFEADFVRFQTYFTASAFTVSCWTNEYRIIDAEEQRWTEWLRDCDRRPEYQRRRVHSWLADGLRACTVCKRVLGGVGAVPGADCEEGCFPQCWDCFLSCAECETTLCPECRSTHECAEFPGPRRKRSASQRNNERRVAFLRAAGYEGEWDSQVRKTTSRILGAAAPENNGDSREGLQEDMYRRRVAPEADARLPGELICPTCKLVRPSRAWRPSQWAMWKGGSQECPAVPYFTQCKVCDGELPHVPGVTGWRSQWPVTEGPS